MTHRPFTDAERRDAAALVSGYLSGAIQAGRIGPGDQRAVWRAAAICAEVAGTAPRHAEFCHERADEAPPLGAFGL